MFRAFIIPSIVSRRACVSVRNYRRAGTRHRRDQAGVRIQYGIFRDLETMEEDPERTYDADFNHLHISHDQHENELELKKEQLKYYVVKNKYFKEKKLPNFLTWAEKEQIRQLHKQDPKEWTPERLAESFPAIEEVIVKILKSYWKPANMQRVQKHDEKVRQNWELFKANGMNDLDPDVSKHLKKFSNRNFDSIKNAYAQIKDDQFEFKFPEPKNKEFLHILTSCKRNKTKKEQMIDQDDLKQIDANENVDHSALQLSKKLRKRNVTFNQLVKKTGATFTEANEEMHLQVSLPQQDNLTKVDSKPSTLIQHTSNDVNEITDVENAPETEIEPETETETETIDLTLTESNTTSQIVQKYSMKKGYSKSEMVPIIRHKIVIPSKLRKKGTTYKLYDCFYDDRGMFMYRVPGLID